MSAWLHLHLDQRGDARAELQLPYLPPEPERWHQALAATLGGPLQQIHEETRGPTWTLHARADAVLNRAGWTIEGVLDLDPWGSCWCLLESAFFV